MHLRQNPSSMALDPIEAIKQQITHIMQEENALTEASAEAIDEAALANPEGLVWLKEMMSTDNLESPTGWFAKILASAYDPLIHKVSNDNTSLFNSIKEHGKEWLVWMVLDLLDMLGNQYVKHFLTLPPTDVVQNVLTECTAASYEDEFDQELQNEKIELLNSELQRRGIGSQNNPIVIDDSLGTSQPIFTPRSLLLSETNQPPHRHDDAEMQTSSYDDYAATGWQNIPPAFPEWESTSPPSCETEEEETSAAEFFQNTSVNNKRPREIEEIIETESDLDNEGSAKRTRYRKDPIAYGKNSFWEIFRTRLGLMQPNRNKQPKKIMPSASAEEALDQPLFIGKLNTNHSYLQWWKGEVTLAANSSLPKEIPLDQVIAIFKQSLISRRTDFIEIFWEAGTKLQTWWSGSAVISDEPHQLETFLEESASLFELVLASPASTNNIISILWKKNTRLREWWNGNAISANRRVKFFESTRGVVLTAVNTAIPHFVKPIVENINGPDTKYAFTLLKGIALSEYQSANHFLRRYSADLTNINIMRQVVNILKNAIEEMKSKKSLPQKIQKRIEKLTECFDILNAQIINSAQQKQNDLHLAEEVAAVEPTSHTRGRNKRACEIEEITEDESDLDEASNKRARETEKAVEVEPSQNIRGYGKRTYHNRIDIASYDGDSFVVAFMDRLDLYFPHQNKHLKNTADHAKQALDRLLFLGKFDEEEHSCLQWWTGNVTLPENSTLPKQIPLDQVITIFKQAIITRRICIAEILWEKGDRLRAWWSGKNVIPNDQDQLENFLEESISLFEAATSRPTRKSLIDSLWEENTLLHNWWTGNTVPADRRAKFLESLSIILREKPTYTSKLVAPILESLQGPENYALALLKRIALSEYVSARYFFRTFLTDFNSININVSAIKKVVDSLADTIAEAEKVANTLKSENQAKETPATSKELNNILARITELTDRRNILLTKSTALMEISHIRADTEWPNTPSIFCETEEEEIARLESILSTSDPGKRTRYKKSIVPYEENSFWSIFKNAFSLKSPGKHRKKTVLPIEEVLKQHLFIDGNDTQNSYLQWWAGNVTLPENSTHPREIPLDQMIAIFKQALISNRISLIQILWEKGDRLKTWWSGQDVTPNDQDQLAIFLEKSSDLFGLALLKIKTSGNKIIPSLWRENTKLRDWWKGNTVTATKRVMFLTRMGEPLRGRYGYSSKLVKPIVNKLNGPDIEYALALLEGIALSQYAAATYFLKSYSSQLKEFRVIEKVVGTLDKAVTITEKIANKFEKSIAEMESEEGQAKELNRIQARITELTDRRNILFTRLSTLQQAQNRVHETTSEMAAPISQPQQTTSSYYGYSMFQSTYFSQNEHTIAENNDTANNTITSTAMEISSGNSCSSSSSSSSNSTQTMLSLLTTPFNPSEIGFAGISEIASESAGLSLEINKQSSNTAQIPDNSVEASNHPSFSMQTFNSPAWFEHPMLSVEKEFTEEALTENLLSLSRST